MPKLTRNLLYHFRGVGSPPAVGSADGGPWVKKITAAGGSPTVAPSADGMALALDATNEVQNLCLYMGDVLPFDIDDIIRLEVLAKISASLDASVSAAFGLAAARNDDLDAIAAAAWFKLAGSNDVVLESDDGTNDNNDAATGVTLADTFKRFSIDFSAGVLTQSPPSQSLGGKAALQFQADNANGYAQRVGANTAFNMSNYSSGLQLFAQLQKTAGTATGTLTIQEFCVTVKTPA